MTLSQEPVQKFADRPGDGEENEHERDDDPAGVGANGNAVFLAEGLRDDLAEEKDGRDGKNDGGHHVDNFVEHEGQSLHGRGVGEQQGDQQ